MPKSDHRSFEVTYDRIINVLTTYVLIAQAFDPEKTNPHPSLKEYKAIWDTGATNSVISQKVVDGCELKPIGMTQVQTAERLITSGVFLVNIMLPHKVGIPHIRVTKGHLGEEFDVLIGMDIIGRGDFAVYPKNGQTIFSFRLPAAGNLNFSSERPVQEAKIGRNDPCHCGSGKKYKKCHGL